MERPPASARASGENWCELENHQDRARAGTLDVAGESIPIGGLITHPISQSTANFEWVSAE